MSHPQSYELLLVPEHSRTGGGPGRAVRSAVVAATGDTGESGYPRYEGGGIAADIDPATHTVEAVLIDGEELDYGMSVRIAAHGAEDLAEPAEPVPGTDAEEPPDHGSTLREPGLPGGAGPAAP
ncbi:hypothetical protein ACIP6P_20005 [Streptomyces sp. NPDC088729]|uniref:hypothetical protein n=1 Tax=unclassified Streptomyces TaxID=2593676 RepID=UPI001F14E637|nr:hypothetical protein [Streptomyces sp. ADI96-02]